MKRFFVYMMGISFFFVGLGVVVENVGAKLKSDEKALEIIRAARTAIGGESKLREVRGLIITGKTTRSHKVGGTEKTSVGDTEIAIQYPDKMLKTIKMGDGDGIKTRSASQEITVVGRGENTKFKVIGKDAEMKAAEAHQFKVEKGADGEFTTEDGRKVIIRHDVEKVAGGDGEAKVFVRKSGDGSEWKTENGKIADVEAHKIQMARHDGMRQNELLRTTLGLLLTAPEGMDVSYTFVGEGDVDGTAANIVSAEFGGQSFKLYIGKSNSLPLAIGYVGHPMPEIIQFNHKIEGPAEGTKDVVMFKRHDEAMAKGVDCLVKFSDFRDAGGVQLPYRWTTTVGDKASDVFDVTSYDLNPANIGERFKEQNVIMKMRKPDGK